MYGSGPGPIEHEANALSRLIVVTALLALATVLIQVKQEYASRADREIQAEMPLALRSPAQ